MQQFDRIHLREGEREAHETFMRRLMHLVSLMHALALQVGLLSMATCPPAQ